jgi:DNA polymerase-3 subunit beta
MNIKVAKSDIADVLSKVQGLTGRRSSLAITENVLVRTTTEGIALIATDLETGFEGTYPATVEKEGVIAITARKFFEIIREFPSDEICINEVENRWIEIGNKNVQYHIVGMNPDDFPDSPLLEDIAFFDIDSGAFKKMIEKTVMVGGTLDDKRAHINGIFFEKIAEQDHKIIRMVSTDGSRLATVDYEIPEDKDIAMESAMIIPKKGLNEVSKFLASDGTVQIGFKDNHFVVKKDSETIIIRLLEGEFPEYREIIAKSEGHSIKVDKALFTKMLKRMSILTSDNYKGAIFAFGANNLVITATNPDIGESKEEMAIDYQGDLIEVAFNPKYFIEILNVIESPNVLLFLASEDKPCFIEGENETNFLSVIMPMRI